MEAMATVHMSEAEVARDLHAALARVQQGVEIVIEQDHRPVAVLKPSASTRPGRKLSECIELAKAYEARLGYAPIPDENFARDVQAGINGRRDSDRRLRRSAATKWTVALLGFSPATDTLLCGPERVRS